MACWQVLTVGLASCVTTLFIYNSMFAEVDVAEDEVDVAEDECDIDDGCTVGCVPIGCVWFHIRTPLVNNCELLHSFNTVSNTAWRRL